MLENHGVSRIQRVGLWKERTLPRCRASFVNEIAMELETIL